jgi:hypothetical protein
MDDAQALHDAGYRRVIDRWLKPLGPSLLVYEPDKRRWSQVYRDRHGSVSVFTSVERVGDLPLGPWLAVTESYNARLGLPDVGDFHFRTSLQIEGLA